jgi:hypothetical protein
MRHAFASPSLVISAAPRGGVGRRWMGNFKNSEIHTAVFSAFLASRVQRAVSRHDQI